MSLSARKLKKATVFFTCTSLLLLAALTLRQLSQTSSPADQNHWSSRRDVEVADWSSCRNVVDWSSRRDVAGWLSGAVPSQAEARIAPQPACLQSKDSDSYFTSVLAVGSLDSGTSSSQNPLSDFANILERVPLAEVLLSTLVRPPPADDNSTAISRALRYS